MNATVYEIRHLASDHHYIGVSSQPARRWLAHLKAAEVGKGFKLHAAIRKHGAAAFGFSERAQLPTQDEAFIAERILIALEQPAFNLTAGGEGVKGTPEVRAKLAAKATGRRHTEETRKIIREKRALQIMRKGPFTPEHKKALAEAHKGLKQTPETRAKRSESLKRAYAEGRKRRVTGMPRDAMGRILPKPKAEISD